MEQVTLVNKDGFDLGACGKIEAHQKGLLHRAFSIFLFNSRGELLLQKRNEDKYHSGGLWTNTCCSHPRPGENTQQAAHRRLQEEMGIQCELTEVLHFVYKARLDKEMIEHEFDHVFFGTFEGEPNPSPEEVEDWKWSSFEEIHLSLRKHFDDYTYWFKHILGKVEAISLCQNSL